MKARDRPLVLMEWLDSRRPATEWRHLADYEPAEPCLCASVGWLIHDGLDVKALVPNMADIESDGNMQVSGIIHVPARAVTRIVPLIEDVGDKRAAGGAWKWTPRLALLTAALLCTTLAAPAAAAPSVMTLGQIVGTALKGCDLPTPVYVPPAGVFSNVSDCSPPGGPGRISSAWERLWPTIADVGNLATHGNGGAGQKLLSAVLDGTTVYVVSGTGSASGGIRIGWNAHADQKTSPWQWGPLIADFDHASLAQASPDSYQYVYLRDAVAQRAPTSAYDLARVPKGKLGDLSAWEIFAGTPASPAWLPWAQRSSRKPVLDVGRPLKRALVSLVNGCWTAAVTLPPPGWTRGAGLLVYTASQPWGPFAQRYADTSRDLGESAMFSPLWPGLLLTSEGDQFVWRSYTMPAGCQ